MISGNFYTNTNNGNLEFSGKKMTKPDLNFDTVQKEVLGDFFKTVRQNVPERGDFETVYKIFKDPVSDDEYRVFISPSHVEGQEDIRRLYFAYKIPDTLNMKSAQILKGKKVEILDFLGNEDNAKEVNSLLRQLKASADE